MNKCCFLLLGWMGVVALSLSSCQEKDATDSAVRKSFIIINGAEPESLDPHFISGVREHRIYISLFEGLVAMDPATGESVPGLAESWEVNESEDVYTFHLRETTWSDGVPITAKTVYDSWMRILNPETAAPYAWFPGSTVQGAAAYNSGQGSAKAVGLRVVDQSTFEVTLVGPKPYFLALLPHYSFGVVPGHAIEKYGPSWSTPEHFVGNGPFVLESWEPQSEMTCVPNDRYWDRENVHLERVSYLVLENAGTAYQMYLNGEADWLPSENIPSERFEEALGRDDVQSIPTLNTYYYGFNVNEPPLDDVRVRKALAHAVDRTPLVKRILKGGEPPAYTIVSPLPHYEGIEGIHFDVDSARDWLAQAGYPDGQSFPQLVVLYNTNERHKAIAEYIQSEWEKNLNITIILQNMEWKSFLPAWREGDFQIARSGWTGDFPDPTTFLQLFTSLSDLNGPGWRNTSYDSLLEEAERSKAGPAREALLIRAERLLIEEETVVMPLFHSVDIDLIDTTRWGGWYPNLLMKHPTKNVYYMKGD